MSNVERMRPLDAAIMSAAQRAAAAELAAGPRGGVKGPFIALLRSPDLMQRLQKVGEYLRFGSSLAPRISEFVILAVSRQWTQQFEWAVHASLAMKAGVSADTVAALAQARRPATMAADEAVAYELYAELLATQGVSDASYRQALEHFGEQGVVEMLALIGYFITVSMIMNVAHTPAPPGDVPPLQPLPL